MGGGKKNSGLQVEKHWTFKITGNCKKKLLKNVFLYISWIGFTSGQIIITKL